MKVSQAPVTAAPASNAQNVITSVKSSQSSTGNSLTQFHLFPKLPLEIRRMIFKEALQTKNLMLFVNWNLGDTKGEIGLFATICNWGVLSSRSIQEIKDFDMPLLAACSESRDIYVKHNKSILPAFYGGVIRYHVDETAVFIYGFAHMESFPQLYVNGTQGQGAWYRQKWFAEIKHLITSVRDLRTCICPDGSPLERFSNVESWTGMLGKMIPLLEATQVWENYGVEAQKRMKIYQKVNPNYIRATPPLVDHTMKRLSLSGIA
ncbi:hypothetical protein VTL71DRAFT_4741 [Oculimacula yallundae]|uniref:2EXR domain-containing protein n=1 Tax=Oculimacula yallundae TaxID=86028 RepID=A0ABR4C3Z9_9HELO